jgi:hypothetical protein
MTVPIEQIRYVYQGPFSVGNIAPIPFTYTETECVSAYRDAQPLELNVDYAVFGQNVTLLTPIAATETLVICRETPLDQDSEFPQEAEFDSQKVMDALDKLTMQNQEQEDLLSRAIKLPIDTPTNIGDLDLPLPEANKALKWNSTADALINTKYDPDAIADEARHQAEIAAQQAAIAAQKAVEASSSANLAQAAVTQVNAAKNEALEDIDEAATTAAAGVTASINAAKEAAIQEVEDSSTDVLNLAESWAIGDITDRPEGSAKWWAEQTAQLVQGETYTKNETDALLAQKEDKLTIGFGLAKSADNTLSVVPSAFDFEYPTIDDMNEAIAEGLATKQGTLTAGEGITISDTNVISATGGGTAPDSVYTKDETNALLATKQNTLVAGTGISLEGSIISTTVDSYSKQETLGLLSTKQNNLTAGNYITIQNNVISATPENMISTFTETQWDALTDTQKSSIALALIYE